MISLLSSTFLQMAYVTSDIDQAAKVFSESFGVDSFLMLRDYEIETLAGARTRKHIGLAYAGAVQIEIMQPLSGDDGVWRAALEGKTGFELVFHHEGHLLASSEALDEVRTRSKAKGFPVVVDGEAAGSARYIYVDHRATIGHLVEYIWYQPQAYAQLEAAIPRY